MTISVVGPRRSYKALPKAKLSSKKIMFTVCWSAVHLIHIAFWNLAKPLCLRNMLTKLMRCTKNHNACSWHQSTGRDQFFSMTMPDCTMHNQCLPMLQSWMNWAMKVCLCHIHLTSCLFFKHIDNFFSGKCFHSQQETENAFQEFIKSQSMHFLLQELTNLFLIGKNVLIEIVPILINKDMLKPSYDDLKAMVQNHNYVCTNLITWVVWQC